MLAAPSHLQVLEAEAIHVMREVAAELERPVLLFSGGKDSIVSIDKAACARAPRRARHHAKSLHADTIEAVETASRGRGDGTLDLALLTDGLRAEREQGITIDVAYRRFATPRRRFIIADTPGHAQDTRNMVTGASTADLAIVLVDAREGLLTQSRRHAAIAGLLGIPRIVLAAENRTTGSFILIDEATDETVGAGMIDGGR